MDPHEEYINGLGQTIYNQNKEVGWWDDPDRCLFTCLQLISTEIAEATEGDRKNLMDDHLPEHKMEEVELADALIRTLDFGAHLGIQYNFEIANIDSWCTVIAPAGKQHLGLNKHVIAVAELMALFVDDPDLDKILKPCYSSLVINIIQVAHNRGFELYQAVEDKIEYNFNRADHKRENREKENGKKY